MIDQAHAQMLEAAQTNLKALSKNQYPGRGIVMGVTLYSDIVQIYWIMGRSEDSRNRIFGFEGDRLFTVAADPTKMKNPSLIIYNAMREFERGWDKGYVVSNGNQTDTVADGEGSNLATALQYRQYEPDEPNFTPRITGLCKQLHNASNPHFEFSVLKKSPWSPECDRSNFSYADIQPGFGYGVTTYMGDSLPGQPLPAWTGSPLLLPVRGETIQEIAKDYWDVLNLDNRVALAVKIIPMNDNPSTIHIINRYTRVS